MSVWNVVSQNGLLPNCSTTKISFKDSFTSFFPNTSGKHAVVKFIFTPGMSHTSNEEITSKYWIQHLYFNPPDYVNFQLWKACLLLTSLNIFTGSPNFYEQSISWFVGWNSNPGASSELPNQPPTVKLNSQVPKNISQANYFGLDSEHTGIPSFCWLHGGWFW